MNRCAPLLFRLLPLLCVLLLACSAAHAASPALIVDSRMRTEEAFDGLSKACPETIRSRQKLITVEYYSFDRKLHQGQLLIDRALEQDIKKVFALARAQRFAIHSVIPAADPSFRRNGAWDDGLLMAANNTSGFNYRRSTASSRLSQHAYGRAVDINPMQNPYVKDGVTLPEGAAYRPQAAGTLTRNHPLVRAFLQLGWTWGGTWTSLKDYQHFEKPLP